MAGRTSHVVRGAVVALALTIVAPVVGAQTFVGPTRSYAASGCALGSVGFDPSTNREIQGTVVCAQGTGLLGYTQLSGLTLLTMRLNLTYMPGPSFPANAFVYSTSRLARLEYTGLECTTAPVCSAQAVNGPSADLQFFPPVSSIGAVDLATINITVARLFFDYTNPTIAGFGSSSTSADLQLTAVPELSVLALTVGGLAALGVGFRRRTRASA